VIVATVNHLTSGKIAHLDLTPPAKSGNGDSEQPYRILWRHQVLEQVESQARTIIRSVNDGY
jgi:hypothetical protein